MQPRRIHINRIIPATFGLITTIAIGIFLFFIFQNLNHYSQQRLITSAKAMTLVTADLLYSPVSSSEDQVLDTTVENIIESGGILYTAIRNETGNIITEARSGGFLADSVVYKTIASQALSQQQVLNQVHKNTLIVTAPISERDNFLGTVEIVHDLNLISRQTQSTIYTLLGIALVIILLGILGSYLFTRYSFRQINQLANAAEEIDHGNLDVAVPSTSIVGISTLATTLNNARNELKKMHADLGKQREDFEKSTAYIEATSLVAGDMISIQDRDQLLFDTMQTIQDKFGFYQQGIYLVDQTGEWAILRAFSGEGADELSNRGSRLRIGVDGIIGHVIENGERYLTRNVTNDPYYLPMTETKIIRSELAIPLRSSKEIIGGLDFRSRNPDAFTEEAITALQTLADQISMALTHLDLYHQAQDYYENLQRVSSDLGHESWRGFLSRDFIKGIYCSQEGITNISDIPENMDANEYPIYEVPVTTRGGQVIGKIRARKRISDEDWSAEEVSIMKSLVEQLGIALDSARLYQETQIAAQREQAISEVTTKIRETLDLETIVKTASEEIRKALNLPEVTIHFGQPVLEKKPRS